MKTVINGVGGVVYEDEFYFEDEEELNALLEDLGADSNENSLVLSSTQIVKDFIGAFSRHEERIQAPVYLEQVNQAVNELSEFTHKQELQISEMGLTAIEVFEKASNVIGSMNDQKKILEKQLEELEESQSRRQPAKSNSFSSSIIYFPTVQYTGAAKVLNVRELSPCRYLTSFLFAYEHYLHYNLNKKVKFVIVRQKGKGVADKYSAFTSITQESLSFDNLYENEVVVTDTPKKDVMNKLLHQNNDIVIVLDRLYGGTDILSGRVKKINAVSGFSDLARYKVDATSCIFPITSQSNEFFNIPLIKNYPREVDRQHAVYAQTCKEQFLKLDNLLGL